jgi:predicted Zn-dependent protease
MRSILHFTLATFFGAWQFTAATAAIAQSTQSAAESLRGPGSVVLYVDKDMKYVDFVEPLVCALRRVLVAPVDSKDIRLQLSRSMLASPTQFDVGKVAGRFIRATALEGTAQTYKYLLFPFDMKDATYHFVFATSFPGRSPPYQAGVISTARLVVTDDRLTRHERAQMTALRAYKLILKSIARLAGYGTTNNGCILAFPRTLEELDDKSDEFCPDDRSTLVDAGILRPKEVEGCEYISEVPMREISAITPPLDQ